MVLSRKLLQLIAAFCVTLLIALSGYFLTNPLSVPVHPVCKISENVELWTQLSKTVSDLGIDIEISKELPLERLQKLEAELDRILSKTTGRQLCEQYALVATKTGWYPCYNCGTEILILLKAGETWKYGKTCIGEEKRYGNLRDRNLLFVPEFEGNEIECLIIEKIKIYNYLVHPENIKRAYQAGIIPLLRPPGNKIDR